MLGRHHCVPAQMLQSLVDPEADRLFVEERSPGIKVVSPTVHVLRAQSRSDHCAGCSCDLQGSDNAPVRTIIIMLVYLGKQMLNKIRPPAKEVAPMLPIGASCRQPMIK